VAVALVFSVAVAVALVGIGLQSAVNLQAVELVLNLR
jgi:hypothetical protein